MYTALCLTFKFIYDPYYFYIKHADIVSLLTNVTYFFAYVLYKQAKVIYNFKLKLNKKAKHPKINEKLNIKKKIITKINRLSLYN